jgi:hypothetical protein
METKAKIKEDLVSKIQDLSRKYAKSEPGKEDTRHLIALEEDKDLLDTINGNTQPHIFRDIPSLEKYLDSLKPGSKDANAAVIIRLGRHLTQQTRKKENLEIPVICVQEQERYRSKYMLEAMDKSSFDFIPGTRDKIKAAVDYAFLAHKEKYLAGESKEIISLRQARRQVEKPTILLSIPDKQIEKNLDSYMASLGLDIRVADAEDCLREYDQFKPHLLLIDPSYIVEKCIQEYNFSLTTDGIGNLDNCRLLEIIPPEKKQEALDIIETKQKQIKAEQLLHDIGEDKKSLAKKLVRRMKTQTKVDESLLFIQEPTKKQNLEEMISFVKENKVDYISSSLRPYEVTRLLLNHLISHRQNTRKPADNEIPPNRIYVLAGPTCSGKTVTAALLQERMGNAEIIGNIKPGERRVGEDQSKDVYLDLNLIETIKRGRSMYARLFKSVPDDVVQALTVNPYSYNHFGNQYHLLYPKIIKTLESGKDVILLTNLQGLETIKEMKKNEGVKNEIVSCLLMAPQEALEARLTERLKDGRINQEELTKRKLTLQDSLEEYIRSSPKFDMVLSTDNSGNRVTDVQERVSTILEKREEITKKGTVEYRESYVPSRVKKLTNLDIYDVQNGQIILHHIALEPAHSFYQAQKGCFSSNVYSAIRKEIVTTSMQPGVYTIYLNGENETEESRKIFLKYLEFTLGIPTQKNEKISYYPASMMGKSKLTYKMDNTTSPIKVSDVASYEIEPNKEGGLHTLVIAMLEKYDNRKGGLAITELK